MLTALFPRHIYYPFAPRGLAHFLHLQLLLLLMLSYELVWNAAAMGFLLLLLRTPCSPVLRIPGEYFLICHIYILP
jgi:hypothetical protein